MTPEAELIRLRAKVEHLQRRLARVEARRGKSAHEDPGAAMANWHGYPERCPKHPREGVGSFDTQADADKPLKTRMFYGCGCLAKKKKRKATR